MLNMFANGVVLSYPILMWNVWDVATWELLVRQFIAINVLKPMELVLMKYIKTRMQKIQIIMQQQSCIYHGEDGQIRAQRRNMKTAKDLLDVPHSVHFARSVFIVLMAVTVIAGI